MAEKKKPRFHQCKTCGDITDLRVRPEGHRCQSQLALSNSHKTLVEAAKWALSTLTDHDEENLNDTDKATIEILRSAITQAEEVRS